MRLSVVSLLMILTTVFLSACGRDELASLDDRSQMFYGRTGVMSVASAAFTTAPAIQAAPISAISSNDLAPASGHAPAIINTSSVVARPIMAANNPWQWPVNGEVAERFGKQGEGIANEGITIAAPEGTPIRAAQAGEVAYVGHGVRDYGNIVILRHPSGEMTSYAHASDIIVNKGQQVAAGATLGHVGTSGNAKTPQLHFALRSGDRAVDPLTKLPSQLASR
ncbi:MAG: murein hydrolase activator EnvC family protein [Rickettsiales bacterium]